MQHISLKNTASQNQETFTKIDNLIEANRKQMWFRDFVRLWIFFVSHVGHGMGCLNILNFPAKKLRKKYGLF